MKNRTLVIKRILRTLLIVSVFVAFAGGQAFAADSWPEGVQDNGIPALVLTIDEGEFQNVIESGDHSYTAENTGEIKIYVPNGYKSEYTGNELFDSKDLSLESFRGRGHSSWWHEKKPFKIKLAKSQNLLDMGKNKHWVLLANAFDDSRLKNRLVGYMGRELGLDYTPKYVPVDFYVNDQYYGNYLLAQQVRIHETRVNIPELTAEDNEGSAVTGGYLLSMVPYTDGPDSFKTTRGVEFQTEEPSFAEGETGTAAQHEYITNFLQETEDAIYSDTDPNDEDSVCAEYMDLRSAARYWWVQEFTRNVDAFKTTSTYLYKDRDSNGEKGKLYWGPLWDFDFSCNGVADGYVTKMDWLDWMRYFDSAYQKELLDGWNDYDMILTDITKPGGMLDQYAAEIEQSWKADYLRWNPDVDPKDTAAIDEAFAKAVSKLGNYLDNRRAWFEDEKNLGELYGAYYSATFQGEGKEPVTKYYKVDTDLNMTSILKKEFQRDGYIFLGWMDEVGNLIDGYVEMNADRVFTAKYLSEEEATLPKSLYFPEQERWVSLEDSHLLYLGSEEYMITPKVVDDDTIRWTSSDESIAEIDDDFITFNKAGTVVITGTARGGATNSFTLHIVNGDVDGDIEDFTFAQETLSLAPGEFRQNIITVTPENKPVSTWMRYSSSDKNVATVNSMGVVEAKALGVCTITAEDYWSDVKKSYTVIVLLPDYTNKTVVLMSNDVHGAIDGYQYMAGLRDELESRGADVIVVDSGDYIQGSKEVSGSKGKNAIRMMNKVGYDLATVGNHEFDYHYSRLQELLGEADFDVVSDNIISANGGYAFDGTKIISGDVKVGFVGITTPETQSKTSPSVQEVLTFLDNKTNPTIFDQAAADVAKLDGEGADVILCLSHLGVDEESVPFRSYDLWEAVKSKGLSDTLDYILDGHSHTVMTEGINGEPIISTGTKFQNIGVITIDESTGALDQIAKPFLYEITKGLYTNAAVKAEADVIAEEIDEIYGVQVGLSEVNLNGARNTEQAEEQGLGFTNGNRDGETNMGDFATDALRWYALKDGTTYDVPEDHIIGLYNGGAIRSGINKGNIKRGDVLSVFPFANTIDGIYVTGAQLLEALEASLFSYPAPGPGFPHVSGMEYTVNTGVAYQPAASTYPASTYYPPAKIKRTTINNINGKPFSATDTYLVVTSSFIAEGGDTYGAFRGIPRIAIADLDEELFCTYIKDGLGGVIDDRYAAPAGRIQVINEEENFPPGTVSIEGAKVVLSKTAFTYNGKVRKPSIKTIKGRKLKAGTDYTVKWSNKSSKKVGKYTLTITGKGNYTGTAKASYKINPKGTKIKTLKKRHKAIQVKWRKQSAKMSTSRITGYQIQVATNKKFTKNKKTVYAKGYKKVSKVVKGLKGGKKYYVHVRTYKKIKGTNYYSPWSKTKAVRTRK